jgi:hypothetical protein
MYCTVCRKHVLDEPPTEKELSEKKKKEQELLFLDTFSLNKENLVKSKKKIKNCKIEEKPPFFLASTTPSSPLSFYDFILLINGGELFNPFFETVDLDENYNNIKNLKINFGKRLINDEHKNKNLKTNVRVDEDCMIVGEHYSPNSDKGIIPMIKENSLKTIQEVGENEKERKYTIGSTSPSSVISPSSQKNENIDDNSFFNSVTLLKSNTKSLPSTNSQVDSCSSPTEKEIPLANNKKSLTSLDNVSDSPFFAVEIIGKRSLRPRDQNTHLTKQGQTREEELNKEMV